MSRERSATSFVRRRLATLRSLARCASAPLVPPSVCTQRYEVVVVLPRGQATLGRVAPLVSSSSHLARLLRDLAWRVALPAL
jgi:hypothetical protein